MQTHIATTPFGRRTMSLAQLAQQSIGRSAPKDTAVHKWQVFQHIREARDRLGATDRALTILNALLSFHPETTLSARGGLIVWPSNDQLAARANGMPATTLRRHLANLVECGLIIRRDSPNGKRFARKGRGGDIEQVYGFDLSPIVTRADAFKDMAEAVQADKRARQVAREQLTLLRRDIAKTITAARAEGAPGPWEIAQHRYDAIISQLPRQPCGEVIEAICADLRHLWDDIRTSLENFTQSRIPAANESHSGGHIKESNPESHSESQKDDSRDEQNAPSGETTPPVAQDRQGPSLSTVIKACPAIIDLAQGRAIQNWRDLLGLAGVVRPMLGISPKLWEETCATLGAQGAATVLAAIYERSGEISNPGGYLRNLTQRAVTGEFSTTPMILALFTAKLRKHRGGENLQHPTPATEPPGIEGGHSRPSITVSAALQQKLKNGSTGRGWSRG
ncbi:plasmid replication protein RepC [Chelatococcus sp. YT9]|uniref:plasmid replication protein RepC n=1 Tax=Chelatococcus sp. YT9 TaxID=2835635 RepID=UPI001BD07AF4|nr:plasmid replication protein RepC [Chelatococcus sp. YT9]MBS7701515.1 replication initiation protein RepC [Chelatococcus sp. YT9]